MTITRTMRSRGYWQTDMCFRQRTKLVREKTGASCNGLRNGLRRRRTTRMRRVKRRRKKATVLTIALVLRLDAIPRTFPFQLRRGCKLVATLRCGCIVTILCEEYG